MIVAVVAEKGGVGKTMVATNLAGMRASTGRRVLLIDADRQGSATFWTEFRAGRDLPQVETQAIQGEAVQALHKRSQGTLRRHPGGRGGGGWSRTWTPRCSTRTAL